MGVIRRCNNCGHSVPVGEEACPLCGGAQAVDVLRAPAAPQHASILTAAVTFCVGLVVLRLLPTVLGNRFGVAALAASDMLAHLQWLIVACTALYLIVRRGEGDFRALFLVSFGLFLASEGVGVVARNYGLITLDSVATILNVALFMYSSLTISAAIADGPKRDFYQHALMFSATGFLLLAALRTFIEIREQGGGGGAEQRNAVMSIILLLVAGGVAALVLLGERQAARRAAAARQAAEPEESGAPAKIVGQEPRRAN